MNLDAVSQIHISGSNPGIGRPAIRAAGQACGHQRMNTSIQRSAVSVKGPSRDTSRVEEVAGDQCPHCDEPIGEEEGWSEGGTGISTIPAGRGYIGIVTNGTSDLRSTRPRLYDIVPSNLNGRQDSAPDGGSDTAAGAAGTTARRRPVVSGDTGEGRFTNTTVPRFDGGRCWQMQ